VDFLHRRKLQLTIKHEDSETRSMQFSNGRVELRSVRFNSLRTHFCSTDIHNFRDWCFYYAETKFEPTGYHRTRSRPLPRVCSFSALLPSVNRVLYIAIYEGVQHRQRFCLNHFNCVKMASSIGATERILKEPY
jgi:hypothetical protein